VVKSHGKLFIHEDMRKEQEKPADNEGEGEGEGEGEEDDDDLSGDDTASKKLTFMKMSTMNKTQNFVEDKQHVEMMHSIKHENK
jgi:hypothetical protein